MASALTKDTSGEASASDNAPCFEPVQQQGAQLTIATWNINGLRKLDPTTYNKSGQGQLTLAEQLKQLGASIVCFQETKISRNDLTEGLAVPQGWSAYFSFSQVMNNAGYSGTATYVKQCEVGTLAAVEGLKGCCGFRRTAEGIFVSQEGCRFSCRTFVEQWESAMLRESETMPEALMDELDREGRIVMTDHGPFVLVNVYVPASREGRGDFKMLFHRALKLRCEAMAAEGREVVLVGDLNAVAARIDHCEPSDDFDTRFTVRWMQSLLTPDPPLFIDTFRLRNPTQASAFTCWNTVTGARKLNYGTRIDYILVTPGLASRLESSCIRPDIEGSDHCPCFATLSSPPNLAEHDPSAPPVPISGESVLRAKGKQSKLHAFLHRPPTNGSTQAAHIQWHGTSQPPQPAPPPSTNPPARASSKRAKGGGAAQGGKQQRRLDQFFARRSPTPPDTPERGGTGEEPSSQPQSQSQEQPQGEYGDWFSGTASSSGSVLGGMGPATSASSAAFLTAAARSPPSGKASSAQWKALFRPRSPVKCRCGEPAVERTVLKEGPNMGRKFYVCNRPEGPANDPRSRCDYFSWKTAYLGQDKKQAASRGVTRKITTKK